MYQTGLRYPTFSRALEEGRITEEDADLITRFISDRKVTKDIGIRRVHKIVFGLVAWRRFIGPFLDNTISDIYRGVDTMKRGKNVKGETFFSQTKYDFVSVLKTFYRWLIDENLSNIPEKKILAIRSPVRENTKTADKDDYQEDTS